MSLPQSTPYGGPDSFDQRWSAWKAAAATQDAIWHRRALVAASLAFLLGGIALVAAVFMR